MHPFSENEVRLATINYEAQEWLSRELHAAFLMSGLTLTDLARELEMDEELTAEWIEGDYDLSLANALDAHVSYRVIPIYNRVGEWLSNMERDIWQSEPWKVPARAR
jgi:hypothetical protein